MLIQIKKNSQLEKIFQRLSALPVERQMVFSAFCAQVFYKNIEIRIKEVGFPRKLDLREQIEGLWDQLIVKEVTLKFDYQSLEDGMISLMDEIYAYPESLGKPNPVDSVFRSSVFAFISGFSFFLGHGDCNQLFFVVHDGVGGKVESLTTQKMEWDALSREEYLKFPTFGQAAADLEWVISKLELAPSKWLAEEEIRQIRDYSFICKTFVVDEIYYEE
ncbi:hypothetical protein EJP67_28100 [Variovorax guangxiensis]|uniref:DUF416 family protein n=1 Tax=Variovorax guangxiensis TaxID=1775474 RepID=A0A3S0XJP3_9BURK|nr:hypothetical protein [Variovorax guangxiensis]RUR70927.1 hypothetical protein EJP67_28100 [Variovorax guangxiensis]